MHPAEIGRRIAVVLWHPGLWLSLMLAGYFTAIGLAAGMTNSLAFYGGLIWAVVMFVPCWITIRRKTRGQGS